MRPSALKEACDEPAADAGEPIKQRVNAAASDATAFFIAFLQVDGRIRAWPITATRGNAS